MTKKKPVTSAAFIVDERFLRRIGACYTQRKAFAERYPEGLPFTRANYQKVLKARRGERVCNLCGPTQGCNTPRRVFTPWWFINSIVKGNSPSDRGFYNYYQNPGWPQVRALLKRLKDRPQDCRKPFLPLLDMELV